MFVNKSFKINIENLDDSHIQLLHLNHNTKTF